MQTEKYALIINLRSEPNRILYNTCALLKETQQHG